MLIAMLDGLRQRERLWDDPRRTPPFALSHRLSIDPHEDAPIAVPAIAEPGEGAPVRPLKRDGRCVLDQLLAEADRWRRRPRSDCPGLGLGIPSVLLRPAGKLPPFFLDKRPELINFHLVQMQIAGQHLRKSLSMGRRPTRATR